MNQGFLTTFWSLIKKASKFKKYFDQQCYVADREGRRAKKCEIGHNIIHLFSTLLLAKLRNRHLEPWNTMIILHISLPLTQLSFEPFPSIGWRGPFSAGITYRGCVNRVSNERSNAVILWELFLFNWLERNEDFDVEYQRNSCRSKRQIVEGSLRLPWSWCYLFARNESYPWVIKSCYVNRP